MERLKFAKEHQHQEAEIIISPTAYIHPLSLIAHDGFGYARDKDQTLVKINHAGGIVIHNGVEIRAFCTIDRATLKGNFTVIGCGTKLDHHCHVAHNVLIGMNNTFANGCVIEGSCEIGDNNTFGTNVIVQKKLKIGSNCIIGSGAVITKDVESNSVMVGNPARLLRKTI